jgi:uncharacterized protein YndB with AHSA1/START domain
VAVIGDRIVQRVHIDAPPEVVFAYLTEPDRHEAWMGRRATLDPRPGGVYRCVMNDTVTVVGRYVTVDRPHAVTFTWGFEGNDALPPGSSTVRITLTADGTGTTVTIVHTGLPHPALALHDQGWSGYLRQLASAAQPPAHEPRR